MPIPDEYRGIIKAAARTAGAIGVPGAFSFGLDVTAMAGIWATMTIAIARASNHEVDKAFAAKLVSGTLAGVAAYVGGSKLAMKLFHLIPGAGTLTAMGINSFLNFFFTWRMGIALSHLFDRGDFTVDDLGAWLKDTIAILTPLPRPSELRDMIALMRDASLDNSEHSGLFEGFRTA